MTAPGNETKLTVTPSHAASQRDAATRGRGPHPLPLFLATLQSAAGADRALLAAALAGLARYQQAPAAPARAPRPEVARVGGISLRDCGGSGPPLVVVPSLINPPDVLDLAPGNSLVGHLVAAGWHPYLVDWGAVPEALGLETLAMARLAPLIASLGQKVPIIGHCLGGTLALAAARTGAASAVAVLAAPWRFDGYGEPARTALADWWTSAEPIARALGAVPIDLLQPAFWSLDPTGLVAKFARLATADDASLAVFARLEDWANGGAPLSLAAAADLAALFADGATGLGAADLPAVPILDVVAAHDRIVPAAAAITAVPAPATRLEIASGHVGMVVGRDAPRGLWAPLTSWLGAVASRRESA